MSCQVNQNTYLTPLVLSFLSSCLVFASAAFFSLSPTARLLPRARDVSGPSVTFLVLSYLSTDSSASLTDAQRPSWSSPSVINKPRRHTLGCRTPAIFFLPFLQHPLLFPSSSSLFTILTPTGNELKQVHVAQKSKTFCSDTGWPAHFPNQHSLTRYPGISNKNQIPPPLPGSETVNGRVDACARGVRNQGLISDGRVTNRYGKRKKKKEQKAKSKRGARLRRRTIDSARRSGPFLSFHTPPLLPTPTTSPLL